MSAAEKPKDNTKNEGAVKAGNGNYIFELTKMAGMDAGIGYSTAFGPVIEGDRMQDTHHLVADLLLARTVLANFERERRIGEHGATHA